MKVALNEANAIQKRIDVLDEKLAKPFEFTADKRLLEIRETLEKAIEVLKKDRDEVRDQLSENYQRAHSAWSNLIVAESNERSELVTARNALLVAEVQTQ